MNNRQTRRRTRVRKIDSNKYKSIVYRLSYFVESKIMRGALYGLKLSGTTNKQQEATSKNQKSIFYFLLPTTKSGKLVVARCGESSSESGQIN